MMQIWMVLYIAGKVGATWGPLPNVQDCETQAHTYSQDAAGKNHGEMQWRCEWAKDRPGFDEGRV